VFNKNKIRNKDTCWKLYALMGPASVDGLTKASAQSRVIYSQLEKKRREYEERTRPRPAPTSYEIKWSPSM
jgi:hypothetical protein